MMTPAERAYRLQLRNDFDLFARSCLFIRTKDGTIAQLVLNDAQRFIHERIEGQRKRTGKVRVLILKGRQQGCSTYVEGRFYHRVSQRFGVQAFILTHTDDSTAQIFGIAKRYHDNLPLPDALKPHTKSSNSHELVFDRLDSGYKIGTAGSKQVGRSYTIQYFHGSEVAFWPHAEDHMAGALQAVPDAPGTEVILESTSDGPRGVFYEMCRDAMEGRGEYELIFVPWFWQSEYVKSAAGFTPTAEENALAADHGLSLEQLAWRRAKIQELRSASKFDREYPTTAADAFKADAEGALWRRDVLKENRVATHPPLSRVVVGVDPAVSNTATSDEVGVVVVGLGVDGHGYVLEDCSLKDTARAWALASVSAYAKHKADEIVAEVNQGGDLVEVNIHTVDKMVPVTKVHAARDKQTRAQPIASLYADGKIHHVGEFPALEDEQCTWRPGAAWSPNRIDALVWACWRLFIDAPPPRVYKPRMDSKIGAQPCKWRI